MNVAGNLSLGQPKIRPTYRTARQICAGCEVRVECLAWAVETNTEFGLWGGLAPWERKPLHRRRHR